MVLKERGKNQKNNLYTESLRKSLFFRRTLTCFGVLDSDGTQMNFCLYETRKYELLRRYKYDRE